MPAGQKRKQANRRSDSQRKQTASARANTKGRDPDQKSSGSLVRAGVRAAAKRGEKDYRKPGDIPDKPSRRQAKRQHAR